MWFTHWPLAEDVSPLLGSNDDRHGQSWHVWGSHHAHGIDDKAHQRLARCLTTASAWPAKRLTEHCIQVSALAS